MNLVVRLDFVVSGSVIQCSGDMVCKLSPITHKLRILLPQKFLLWCHQCSGQHAILCQHVGAPGHVDAKHPDSHHNNHGRGLRFVKVAELSQAGECGLRHWHCQSSNIGSVLNSGMLGIRMLVMQKYILISLLVFFVIFIQEWTGPYESTPLNYMGSSGSPVTPKVVSSSVSKGRAVPYNLTPSLTSCKSHSGMIS